MKRVPDAELDFGPDQVMWHDGERFTGVAFEDRTDLGLSEITYRDGLQEGWARDWYPSGALKGESAFQDGVPHGEITEFDESGSVIERSQWEYGIRVSALRRDESGSLVEVYRLDAAGPEARVLERARRQAANEA